MQYLISAEHFEHARYEAEQRQIPRNQWVYIPWDERERMYRLAGIGGMDTDHLVGGFSAEEIQRLTRPF